MINYPNTHADDFVEEIHGHMVEDPYRWMEDLDSEPVRAWNKAQNRLTFDYLKASPLREKIQERMTALWNYEKYSPPYKRGGRYFYTFNDGLQNQDVFYWMEDLEDEPRVLIDPNQLSEDGTVALSGAAVSRDGQYLAYGLSDAGSDWQTWHVRNVDDGQVWRIRWNGSNSQVLPGMGRTKAFIIAAMMPRRMLLSNRRIIITSFTITAWGQTNPKTG